ncbi:MAG TPA: DUF222 domain-containing protein, partial [Candidatus Dormibacteraeota bacterium]|nr:DUF222 domain-containing protein [Candidatus Dormibacteraeota bacterium]
MVRTANAVGARFDEALLLAKARENSPGKFYYLCNHYRHSADRKGYETEQADLVENRKLWISTGEDGAVWINGVFDPEGGASIRTALEPLARRSGKYDDRCREKRMADALVDLSMHALDSGLIPQQGSQRTHLQITHFARDAARTPWRACGGLGVLAYARLLQDCGAAGLRRLFQPHHSRLQVSCDRRGAGQTNYLGAGPQSDQRPRPGLHLARV